MGLLDSFLPEDPNQNQAARVGLLNLGAALLGSRSPYFGQALGQGVAAGVQGYQGQLQDAQKQKLQDAQLKVAGLEYDTKKLAYDQAEARRRALQKINDDPQQIAPQVPSSPSQSVMYQQPQMQPAWLQATQPAPTPAAHPPAPLGNSGNFGRFLKIAQVLQESGDTEGALKYYETADKFKPKLKSQEVLMQNGKPVQVMTYEDGTQVVSQFGAKPDVQLQSLGNRVMAIDKNQATNGQSWNMGQSPDSVASNALGWANNRQAGQRLSFDQSQAGKPQFHEGMWVTPPTPGNPTGTSVKVPGYGDNKPLTEAQGNAYGFGLRAKESQRLITQLESGGTKTAGNVMTAAGRVPLVGQALADSANALPTWMGGPNAQQQQYGQAKRNFISAVLRKESGAAISPAEFESEDRKYFPQPGDDDSLIEQKRAAREMAVQALETQAGRAIPSASGSAKFEPKSKMVKLDDGTTVGAVRGADGGYYVKRNGKQYRVEE